jgi:hypothetical protein
MSECCDTCEETARIAQEVADAARLAAEYEARRAVAGEQR